MTSLDTLTEQQKEVLNQYQVRMIYNTTCGLLTWFSIDHYRNKEPR